MIAKPLIYNCILLATTIALFSSCATEKKKRIIKFPKTDLSAAHVIPKPLKLRPAYGGFPLDKHTVIQTDPNDTAYIDIARFLVDKIQKKTGLNLPINTNEPSDTISIIHIKQTDISHSKATEAYTLDINQDTITLTSNTAAGAFRGIQTLRQLIPEASNDTLATNKIWVVPSGKILDAPQFKYRATMLDVARHFFTVEDVKNYIDILSYYKINTLHLHLSDDQGWRIEIKSWPKLSAIGGLTEVGGTTGGFYTQKEYKDIIDYAAKHHIMVVPEIDMPGHTNAASVAYPILNGNGKTPKPYTRTRVGFSTLDTKKDTVYKFIDDVVREIASISPGPYFHVGGDESHVTKKADYNDFIGKVEKIVQKHGKQLIGWDEVATAKVDSSSIAQIWRSKKNQQLAIKKGMKIILSLSDKAYLDMKYDADSKFGLDWAGYISVKQAYDWDIEAQAQGKAIGIDAPLWSETISTLDELQYLAFPRVIGHAELGWSTKENRDWENYKIRLAHQAPFLNRMHVNYYPSPLIDWKIN
ncbi:beta-N-acetylhexosaminidase [Flavobacteriaceae bacterium MHTCC 0001]